MEQKSVEVCEEVDEVKYSIVDSVYTFGHYTRNHGYLAQMYRNDVIKTAYITNKKHENKHVEECVQKVFEEAQQETQMENAVIMSWRLQQDHGTSEYLKLQVRILYD